tara:strand:- start:68 stop:280 length:213 start_codon:yes stop_codon:yes gene_type:complete
MSKTKNWIMDIEEKLWDDVGEEIKECATESEAQIYALKLANERGVLDYVGADELEEAVSEMWHEFWSKFN